MLPSSPYVTCGVEVKANGAGGASVMVYHQSPEKASYAVHVASPAPKKPPPATFHRYPKEPCWLGVL